MLDRIQMYLINKRAKSFREQVTREIHRKIFPHLRGQANHGYPFTNDTDLVKAGIAHFNSATRIIEEINGAADRMARAHGDAFFYIAGRDIKNELVMYLQYAQKYEYQPLHEQLTVSCPGEVLG